jgi:hypothetical protein
MNASVSFGLFFFFSSSLFSERFTRIAGVCCIPRVHDMRHSGSDGGEERERRKG